MPEITAVKGDITTVAADVIVNAANNAMRGGGGVDGAIHRAGGPAILDDCIRRFPNGLATGDAGWTTAGDLPARWVIHTVGPNFNAGQQDRTLLESCYRRSLEVADELGATSVAFPLISAGVYGWPLDDAIAAAVGTVAGTTTTTVANVRLVGFDQFTYEAIDTELARRTPLRILQGVHVLHERGYHSARVMCGMSPSGMHWRATIAAADAEAAGDDSVILYSTGSRTEFASTRVTVATSADAVADAIADALPRLTPDRRDPDYVEWFAELLTLVKRHDALPIASADYFDDADGWEIGWGSGARHPHPPPQG